MMSVVIKFLRRIFTKRWWIALSKTVAKSMKSTKTTGSKTSSRTARKTGSASKPKTVHKSSCGGAYKSSARATASTLTEDRAAKRRALTAKVLGAVYDSHHKKI